MCGIIAITNSESAAVEVYKGLLLLQHRGQDSAGILSFNNEENRFHLHKNLGLVASVFSKEEINKLSGTQAIGHTRYSTIGKINQDDIQPLLENYPFGTGAVHNGNIENINELTKMAEATGRYFNSKNDLEVMMHSLSIGLANNKSENFFETLKLAVIHVINTFKGGYSYVSIIAGHGTIAFCDRHGIRPLIIGKKDNSYIFSSESNVLTFLGYSYLRDLKPGELVFINEAGEMFSHIVKENKSLPCMFEWVYFSSAESNWKNKNVYQVRLKLGESLAEKIKLLNLDIDLVSPIPDTSRSAGISLAEKLSIPYREVLIKNRYVQRSFILNTQEKRNEAVDIKFSVVAELVKDKNVLLVDDSIVRGTTSKKIVELIRLFGAKKVYIASTCPPIISPCFYGIAFPSKDELIMNKKTPDELSELIGADKVIFTDYDDLYNALDKNEFCNGCLTGDYPYERTVI